VRKFLITAVKQLFKYNSVEKLQKQLYKSVFSVADYIQWMKQSMLSISESRKLNWAVRCSCWTLSLEYMAALPIQTSASAWLLGRVAWILLRRWVNNHFCQTTTNTTLNPLTPTVAIWVQKHPVPLSVRVPGCQKLQTTA